MSTALNATIIPFPTASNGIARVQSPAARTSARRTSAQRMSASRTSDERSSAVSSHLRLTRRGRFVVTALVAIPLVIGAAAFAINGGGAIASGEATQSTSFSHVTVSSGQSLWQIAERIAPSSDPRDVVAAIIDLNQLPSSLVMPGQRLAIPTQYAG